MIGPSKGPAVSLHEECSGFLFADSDGARVSWLPTAEIIRRCEAYDDLVAACRSAFSALNPTNGERDRESAPVRWRRASVMLHAVLKKNGIA